MARILPLKRCLLGFGVAACLVAPAWTARAAEGDDPDEHAEEADQEGDEAADEDSPAGRRWRAKPEVDEAEAKLAAARTVGRRTGRFLVRAREDMLDEKYDEATAVLAKLSPKRLNPYERALVYRIQGYIFYGKQQVGPAIEHLRKALGENILPKADTTDILYQIAQMQMSQDDFEKAIETMKEWFAVVEKPSSAGYFQLAVAYYQLKNLDAALEPARKAIEIADTPQQPWLQLLLAIYLTKEDYKSATPVLVDLLTRYPEVGKSYWLQLATLYGVQEDFPRALAMLELAHRQKFLTEDSNLRRLASLLQSEEIPLRSAQILEAGFEQKVLTSEDLIAYELLGNSWILARESAKAEPWLKRAADLSPKGDLYVRLGQVLLIKEDWDGAAAALRSALAKGGLDDPGAVEMLLGITYFNAEKLGEARGWFVKARRSAKSRAIADAWLVHIDQEIEKRNAAGAATEPVRTAESSESPEDRDENRDI
jgi:tetratricopeptide (TPR) repeat protein